MRSDPASSVQPTPNLAFGRYLFYAPIAQGGMATIHLARQMGAQGFNRLVIAKRLHGSFAQDPDFVTMFHDEARIASRIQHPNVVSVLDVVVAGGEVVLVQEYAHGVPLNYICNAVKSPDMNWKIGCRPSRTSVEEVLTCPVFRLSA